MPARELRPVEKAIYAAGDFTVNTALSSLMLVYASYFLTQVAGLRPTLAGLIPLIGRGVDAFTDPLMGRLTDMTRSRFGRRRVYFLIGAVPFGISFAMLWVQSPFASPMLDFLYYVAAYCLLSVTMTVLSIPYLALMPEMALDYDGRTSLNTYRNAGSMFGVFAAVGIRPTAEALGGGGAGFALAGICYGILVALPWFAVYRVSFERPELHTQHSDPGFREGLRTLLRHKNFTQLTALYLSGRISMDLVSALLILYFTYWIGRSEDFEISMFLFLSTVVLSLPFWLRFSRGRDKGTMFIVGSFWWMTMSLLFLFVQPDWPRWLVFVIPPVVGLGYAVVDLMPWAMLGEVVDEDDLANGQRREGLYNGLFTFVRKLAGALGVFLVLAILDVAGFEKGVQQTDTVRQTIRILTALAPATFLAVAIWLAWDYPLNRHAHQSILAALAERDRLRSGRDVGAQGTARTTETAGTG